MSSMRFSNQVGYAGLVSLAHLGWQLLRMEDADTTRTRWCTSKDLPHWRRVHCFVLTAATWLCDVRQVAAQWGVHPDEWPRWKERTG